MDDQLKLVGIELLHTRIYGIVGCAGDVARYGLKPGELGSRGMVKSVTTAGKPPLITTA